MRYEERKENLRMTTGNWLPGATRSTRGRGGATFANRTRRVRRAAAGGERERGRERGRGRVRL